MEGWLGEASRVTTKESIVTRALKNSALWVYGALLLLL